MLNLDSVKDPVANALTVTVFGDIVVAVVFGCPPVFPRLNSIAVVVLYPPPSLPDPVSVLPFYPS